MKYCNEEGKPKYQWKSIFNIILYDERDRTDRIDFVVNLLQTSQERFISIRQLDASGISCFK
jgi:tRNA uridine 5-carbamoylmethylation protein Kti12